MKKVFLILIIIISVIFLSSVSANENIVNSNNNISNNLKYSLLEVNESIQSDIFYNNDSLKLSDENHHDVKNNTKLNPIKFSAKNIVSTYGKKAVFSVKILNNQNKVLKNKLVTFKVSGKYYDVYSNLKGVATIKVKLNAGKYSVKYTCDNYTAKNTITIKNYYKITVYKWKSGADVNKNKKIRNNIPNSSLVKKVVKAAKKGTPIIKFKGGNGKIVFITAGVHGNELPSQIAAMRLIKFLADNPIKGTVYIMPFINPKATSSNVRNYGINLNEKANVKGTISYKTVALIKKFKCDAYGDFHCTQPGGKPGSNAIFGSYNPTAQSGVMAKYIASKSKAKHIIYNKAGVEYNGALEDVVNLKGIPAVTCEVISPHGIIAKGSPQKSWLMMKNFLKFNELL